MHRISLTFLAMPPAFVVIVFALAHTFGPTPDMHLSGVLSLVLFYTVFLYVSVTAVALPLFAMLAWAGQVRAWTLAAAGTTAALVILSIPVDFEFGHARLRFGYWMWQIYDPLPFALLGAFCGLTFWLLALKGNPLVRHWNERRRL